MKAALIAAGRGERLRAGGITRPKPLVEVAGRPLIDHVLGAVAEAGIDAVACIFNEEADAVADHCRAAGYPFELEIVRRTTPSSMESLFALAPHLEGGKFLLLTVDAIFPASLLRAFLERAASPADSPGVLAVTRFVDDEKPLWIRLDAGGRVEALGPGAEGSSLVTAGFYVFDPVIFREIEFARRSNFSALRQFLGHLLAAGYRLRGVPVGKTVDVDRPEDVAVAESFVRSGFAA